MTSPSSVRCTGHLAAMTRRRSTCSSESDSGRRTTIPNRVGHPRSAGVYSHATSTPVMSQPLRLAYISIVTAVQEARLAASSSWGLGAVSVPPASCGSSIDSSWLRTLTTWRNPPSRVAVAFMVFLLYQWIEEQPGGHLREEERRLGRHVDTRRGDLAHLLDGGAAQEERGVVGALEDQPARLVVGARVPQPAQVADVILGQAERALQDERLEDRGVQAPVGRGLVGERAIGDRLVLERQPERPPEVAVEVPHRQRPAPV